MRTRLAALLVSLTLVTGCTSASEAPSEWVETTAKFDLDGQTTAPIPADRLLSNGNYWAVVNEVLGSREIVFELYQARFGTTCEKWAAENGLNEGCPDDYYVDTSTHQLLTTSNVKWVSVAEASAPGKSYRVAYSTLVKLVRGEKTDVPQGFSWTPFPFILGIRDGAVTTIDQYWVP